MSLLKANLPIELRDAIFTGDFSVTDGTNTLILGGNGFVVAMGCPLQLNSSIGKVNVTQGSLTIGETGPEDNVAPELKRAGSDVELTKGSVIIAGEGGGRFRLVVAADGSVTGVAPETMPNVAG